MSSTRVVFALSLLLGLGCAGAGTGAPAPAPAPATDAVAPALPDGFVAQETVAGASIACAAKRCGLWAEGWLVEPAEGALLKDGGSGLVYIRTSGVRYYAVERRAFLPGGPWTAGQRLVEDRLWVQRGLGADERVSAESASIYVLLDGQGRVIKELKGADAVAQANDFSGGLAAAYAPPTDPEEDLGLGGYLALDGTWAIAPIYYEVTDFHDGAAAVTTVDGVVHKIDATGK